MEETPRLHFITFRLKHEQIDQMGANENAAKTHNKPVPVASHIKTFYSVLVFSILFFKCAAGTQIPTTNSSVRLKEDV